ncbi:MAG: hypothetical protein J5J00_11855 [Deltaproteobacteria bacterium]|nr:hypothetical protein [Deltaproteobacteria bacterium]
MSTNSSPNRKIKVDDRVKRVGLPNCLGVVKELKTEVTATTPEARERGLMVTVLWDNGTFSYHGPDTLEVVKE